MNDLSIEKLKEKYFGYKINKLEIGEYFEIPFNIFYYFL